MDDRQFDRITLVLTEHLSRRHLGRLGAVVLTALGLDVIAARDVDAKARKWRKRRDDGRAARPSSRVAAEKKKKRKKKSKQVSTCNPGCTSGFACQSGTCRCSGRCDAECDNGVVSTCLNRATRTARDKAIQTSEPFLETELDILFDLESGEYVPGKSALEYVRDVLWETIQLSFKAREILDAYEAEIERCHRLAGCAAGQACCGGRCRSQVSECMGCPGRRTNCPEGEVCFIGSRVENCCPLHRYCSDDASCRDEDECCPGFKKCEEAQVCVPDDECCPPEEKCGDICRDVTSDTQHCGECNFSCRQGPNVPVAICAEGRCQIACRSGFGDCDGDVTTGCETAIWTEEHCRSCGDTCFDGEICDPERGCIVIIDCEDGSACEANQECCPGGGCAPQGTVYCGDGTYCGSGKACSGSGADLCPGSCVESGAIRCGNGMCFGGAQCGRPGTCDPPDLERCGDGFCRPEEKCCGGTCYPASRECILPNFPCGRPGPACYGSYFCCRDFGKSAGCCDAEGDEILQPIIIGRYPDIFSTFPIFCGVRGACIGRECRRTGQSCGTANGGSSCCEGLSCVGGECLCAQEGEACGPGEDPVCCGGLNCWQGTCQAICGTNPNVCGPGHDCCVSPSTPDISGCCSHPDFLQCCPNTLNNGGTIGACCDAGTVCCDSYCCPGGTICCPEPDFCCEGGSATAERRRRDRAIEPLEARAPVTERPTPERGTESRRRNQNAGKKRAAPEKGDARNRKR